MNRRRRALRFLQRSPSRSEDNSQRQQIYTRNQNLHSAFRSLTPVFPLIILRFVLVQICSHFTPIFGLTEDILAGFFVLYSSFKRMEEAKNDEK
jgi:hypothetical protein